ncbi:MAG: hypothetical protein K8Q99_04950 [Acholeplasmataceae bacterium]|nr:hypothetical protein [Acholeplasmataceae bacterium]
MKKISLVLIMLLLIVLVSCTPKEDIVVETQLPKTLKEAVNLYQDKLTAIIDEDENSDQNLLTRFYNDTPYDPNDMIHRDVYLSIYNEQIDNANHVQLTPYLSSYKDLLIEINEILVEYEIDELNVDIQIDFNNEVSLEANVFLSLDKGVVIKFTGKSVFLERPVLYSIKMGYEEDIFFVKELKQYNDEKDQDKFFYFEFLEDTSLIEIDYRDDDNYRYQYKNQVNNELFDIYFMANDYGLDDYVLMWFNPETNIRTIYSDGYEPIRHFEVFNEKTNIFSYTDYLDGMINIRFQLLEATGWDYAYLDSNAHRNQGVYKNNVMLFEEDDYRQFNVDLNEEYRFANVGVMIDLSKDDLNDEILNLHAYDMEFNHPEITMAYISQTIDNSYEESKHLAVYRGIDFYGENVRDDLYQQLDSDLTDS